MKQIFVLWLMLMLTTGCAKAPVQVPVVQTDAIVIYKENRATQTNAEIRLRLNILVKHGFIKHIDDWTDGETLVKSFQGTEQLHNAIAGSAGIDAYECIIDTNVFSDVKDEDYDWWVVVQYDGHEESLINNFELPSGKYRLDNFLTRYLFIK